MKLIPREYFVAFAFALILIGTDDTLHSYSHRHFTPNLTFAFAFVIQKVINSDIIWFRFALISVSMVCLNPHLFNPHLRHPKRDMSGLSWHFGPEEPERRNPIGQFVLCRVEVLCQPQGPTLLSRVLSEIGLLSGVLSRGLSRGSLCGEQEEHPREHLCYVKLIDFFTIKFCICTPPPAF